MEGTNFIGGATRDRTADLLHAMQALSQLSYSPTGGSGRYGRHYPSVNPPGPPQLIVSLTMFDRALSMPREL